MLTVSRPLVLLFPLPALPFLLLPLVHAKMSFGIQIRSHLFLEAFFDHPLHLAGEGFPTPYAHRLPFFLAFTPKIIILFPSVP